MEEEFEALWQEGFPLPDAIIEEIKRVAERVEIRFEEVTPDALPAAALAESPIYRGGEQLQPWQRAFVTLFFQHRETYGKTRLLLADEVGVGKTLSLAAGAMMAALLDDGPVLILCPATLTLQWQVELKDKLGIPSAVWLSHKKVWVDEHGHTIKTRGPEDITRCPFRIAIVSTGLIFHDSDERRFLLERKFGTVVLDEAHKARRRDGLGDKQGEPNNLLDFMLRIGPRTKNLMLGTATPMQTEVSELWELMRILNAGADFVLGREALSNWVDWCQALPVVKGVEMPVDERDAWEWLRNPLPPGDEDPIFASLRLQLGVPDNVDEDETSFRAEPISALTRPRPVICTPSSKSLHDPKPATRSWRPSRISSPRIALRARSGWSTAASFSASIMTRPVGSVPNWQRSSPMSPWPCTSAPARAVSSGSTRLPLWIATTSRRQSSNAIFASSSLRMLRAKD